MAHGSAIIDAARKIVWGDDTSTNINCFSQWTAPLVFSELEPTALVQTDGGPCAVLAPIQAHILLYLIKSKSFPTSVSTYHQFQVAIRTFGSDSCCKTVLYNVLHKLLLECSNTVPVGSLVVVELVGADASCEQGENNSIEQFHNRMKVHTFDLHTDIEVLAPIFETYFNTGGILAFVYSLILTRGIESVNNDLGVMEVGHALIDSVHGHGSIALTNLCLIGTATPNLFDGCKDLSGLVLNGINKTPEIGYLSLLEHYRYLEVGHKMKNPSNPIWILSSETHLTVLCSLERSLCSSSISCKVKQIFSKFDTSSNGFIEQHHLPELLEELELPNDEESLAVSKSKLDVNDFGIITLGAIMEAFFLDSLNAEQFTVITDVLFLHYNGLTFNKSLSGNMLTRDPNPTMLATAAVGGSDSGGTAVQSYSYGVGVIGLDNGFDATSAASKLDLILSTKWPAIQINWCCGSAPTVD